MTQLNLMAHLQLSVGTDHDHIVHVRYLTVQTGKRQHPWQLCFTRFFSVAHHDLDNTLNCSFLEPPSGLEQPSPSWSSRASFSSFDSTDEGPVYCVPHEGEWSCVGIPPAQ